MAWFTPYFDADKVGAGGGGGSGAGGNAGTGAGVSGGNTGNGNPDNQVNQNSGTLDFDTWLKGQPEDVKNLLDGHTKGLKSALESERDTRKSLEKQVRDLAGKAEKGSESEKQLTELADKIGESDRRADFYEAAHAAGVKNLKLAYIVAVSDEMFDKRGNVNFETMKANYPELFGVAKVAPQGNAGSGAGESGRPGMSMNDWIRQRAGRS